MVTVKLPRAEWDLVLLLIEEAKQTGWIVSSLHKEIEDQVYSQEY